MAAPWPARPSRRTAAVAALGVAVAHAALLAWPPVRHGAPAAAYVPHSPHARIVWLSAPTAASERQYRSDVVAARLHRVAPLRPEAAAVTVIDEVGAAMPPPPAVPLHSPALAAAVAGVASVAGVALPRGLGLFGGGGAWSSTARHAATPSAPFAPADPRFEAGRGDLVRALVHRIASLPAAPHEAAGRCVPASRTGALSCDPESLHQTLGEDEAAALATLLRQLQGLDPRLRQPALLCEHGRCALDLR
jgi:hypothetical protein